MQRNRMSKVAGLKVGDRIRLVHMVDDPDPIPAGTMGTVTEIHIHSDWAQIEVSWENGRALMLVSPPDKFEIIEGDR
jgi:hypothetical protein